MHAHALRDSVKISRTSSMPMSAHNHSRPPRPFVNNLARTVVEAGATVLDAKFKVRLGVHAPRGQTGSRPTPTGPSSNLSQCRSAQCSQSRSSCAPLKVSLLSGTLVFGSSGAHRDFLWVALLFALHNATGAFVFFFFFCWVPGVSYRSCRAELTP